MNKAMLYGPRDLRFDERPVPEPGPGEVVARTLRASLCSSDVGQWKGDGFRGVPRGFGHDASAVVAATGPGVSRVRPGDRITLAGWTGCGVCHHCRTGRLGRCNDRITFKPEHQGFFSEYTLMPEALAVPLPNGVTADDGALIEAAYTGITGWKTLGYGPGDLVVLIGAGWMAWGQIQVAAAVGARPVALARNPARVALARRFGAIAAFPPDAPDLVEQLRALNNGEDPFYVIDATGAGAPEGLELAQRIGAKEAVIGLMGRKANVRLTDFMFKHQTLVAVGVWPRKPEAVEWVAAGKIDLKPAISHRFPFHQLGDALALLESDRDSVTKIMIDFADG